MSSGGDIRGIPLTLALRMADAINYKSVHLYSERILARVVT